MTNEQIHNDAEATEVLADDPSVALAYEAFTDDLDDQAKQEGWVLSERDDGLLQIEKADDDPNKHFKSDLDALAYVTDRANAGSTMHQLALKLHGNPVPQP